MLRWRRVLSRMLNLLNENNDWTETISGGTIAGTASQFIGRRLTIMFVFPCCDISGSDFYLVSVSSGLEVIVDHHADSAFWRTAVFIPLWIIPNSFSGLSAGAFFIQVGVQGAWSVVSRAMIYWPELIDCRYPSTLMNYHHLRSGHYSQDWATS